MPGAGAPSTISPEPPLGVLPMAPLPPSTRRLVMKLKGNLYLGETASLVFEVRGRMGCVCIKHLHVQGACLLSSVPLHGEACCLATTLPGTIHMQGGLFLCWAACFLLHLFALGGQLAQQRIGRSVRRVPSG